MKIGMERLELSISGTQILRLSQTRPHPKMFCILFLFYYNIF